MQEISWDEVVRAGTVIFGPTFVAAAEAGGWRSDLRAAYRRRVLETHPDRASILGRAEGELLEEFRSVTEAYELLVELRAGPLPSLTPSPTRRPQAPSSRAGRAQRQPPPPSPTGRTVPPPASGPRSAGASVSAPASPNRAAAGLPRRRLRMAEYLYYSGHVGWHHFVEAIAWQRRQRPAVGRIAMDFGFLERFEVSEILERRRAERAVREPFGEFAVRSGYLTPFQLLALLGQQLRLQRPIGRFFVENGLASDRDLDDARVLIFRHNARQAA